jgi:uncharacterized caspase-like protein
MRFTRTFLSIAPLLLGGAVGALEALTRANAPADAPALFILAVGVEAEQTARGERDCYAADAAQVRAALATAARRTGTLARHEAPRVDRVRSRSLTAGKATRPAVLAGFAWLAATMQPQDTAIVFLSTHGSLDGAGGLYFALAGAHLDERPTQVLWAKELHAALAKMPGRVFVWVDACHAGALADAPSPRETSFLLACQAEQCSYGHTTRRARPHGYFAQALCEGLRGSADRDRDSRVTVAELEAYLPGRVRSLAPRQEVVVRRGGGDRVALDK